MQEYNDNNQPFEKPHSLTSSKTFSANYGHSLEKLRRKRSSHRKHQHFYKDKYHRLKHLCEEYHKKFVDCGQKIQTLKDKVLVLQSYNQEFALENDQLKAYIISIDKKDLENDLSSSKLELEKYKYENHQLKQDLNMTKILIYRLNVQLEKYQDKILRGTKTKTPSETPINEPTNWGSVNTHTLAPLLNALSQSICEKTELIHKCEDTMNTFTWKMKEILMENYNLHQKLEDVNVLKKHVSIWKSRSEVLMQKNNILNKKLSQILACYENKIQSMAIDYKNLYEEYDKVKQQKADVKADHNLHDTCEDKLEKSKKDYEELKAKLENDIVKLTDYTQSLRKELVKLKKKLMKLWKNTSW